MKPSIDIEKLISTDYILFDFIPNKSDIAGFFDPDDGNIYINKRFSVIKRKLTLVHETAHKLCFETKCFCWRRSGFFWAEYHAYRAEFQFVLSVNTKQYWVQYFKMSIIELDKFIEKIDEIASWKAHYLARRKVCLLKKSVYYAKKYGYWSEMRKRLKLGLK